MNYRECKLVIEILIFCVIQMIKWNFTSFGTVRRLPSSSLPPSPSPAPFQGRGPKARGPHARVKSIKGVGSQGQVSVGSHRSELHHLLHHHAILCKHQTGSQQQQLITTTNEPSASPYTVLYSVICHTVRTVLADFSVCD